MDLQNRPELEDLIEYDMVCNDHRPADEYVEHAVSLLHAHQTWFAEDRAENAEQYEGYGF
jgi:hypothetical protein